MLKRFVVCLLVVFICASSAHAQGNSEAGRDNAAEHGGNAGNGNNGNGQGQDGSPGQSGSARDSASDNDGSGAADRESGQRILTPNQVLEAVESRQAAPLSELAKIVRERDGGEIVDANLISTGQFLVYAIKVLARDGALSVQYYYARSGRYIGSE